MTSRYAFPLIRVPEILPVRIDGSDPMKEPEILRNRDVEAALRAHDYQQVFEFIQYSLNNEGWLDDIIKYGCEHNDENLVFGMLTETTMKDDTFQRLIQSLPVEMFTRLVKKKTMRRYYNNIFMHSVMNPQRLEMCLRCAIPRDLTTRILPIKLTTSILMAVGAIVNAIHGFNMSNFGGIDIRQPYPGYDPIREILKYADPAYSPLEEAGLKWLFETRPEYRQYYEERERSAPIDE